MTEQARHSWEHRRRSMTLAAGRLGGSILPMLLVLLPVMPAAWAAPSPKLLCNRALRATTTARSLQRERTRRLDWLARLRSMATSLQNRPQGPARNFRLRAVLAEARQVADRLKELDSEKKNIQRKATRLMAIMVRRARNLDEARRKKLQVCMAELKAILPKPKTSSKNLAHVTIRPDDGPAELERKADLLADSADKLERRLRRLQKAIRRTERQAALQAAAGRARQGDSLLSGRRRRSIATVTPTAKIHGATPPSRQEGGTTLGGIGGNNGYGTNDTTASTPSVRQTNPQGLTLTWSSVLGAVRDLVGPEQANVLAGQAASSNPAVRLAALRRAVEILKTNRRRLRQKAQRLRAQAHRLTGPRPGPRSRISAHAGSRHGQSR